MIRLLPLVLSALVCLSCGDGLLNRRYIGDLYFSFTGKIDTNAADLQLVSLRAGLFWLPFDPTTLGPDFAERTPVENLAVLPDLGPGSALVEQNSISIGVAFPGDFELNVFSEPPAAARDGRPLLYGVVLLYDDRDLDGVYSEGELVGAATSQMVLFTEAPLAAGAEGNTTSISLDAGYALVELPLKCASTPAEFPLDETWQVRVGASCAPETEAEDCGPAGQCLLEDLDGPMPGGYCVLPIDAIPPDQEVPPSLVEVETERDGVELIAYYQVCSKTAACRAGYTCQNDICLPRQPAALVLDPRTEVQDACAEYHEVESRERY